MRRFRFVPVALILGGVLLLVSGNCLEVARDDTLRYDAKADTFRLLLVSRLSGTDQEVASFKPGTDGSVFYLPDLQKGFMVPADRPLSLVEGHNDQLVLKTTDQRDDLTLTGLPAMQREACFIVEDRICYCVALTLPGKTVDEALKQIQAQRMVPALGRLVAEERAARANGVPRASWKSLTEGIPAQLAALLSTPQEVQFLGALDEESLGKLEKAGPLMVRQGQQLVATLPLSVADRKAAVAYWEARATILKEALKRVPAAAPDSKDAADGAMLQLMALLMGAAQASDTEAGLTVRVDLGAYLTLMSTFEGMMKAAGNAGVATAPVPGVPGPGLAVERAVERARLLALARAQGWAVDEGATVETVKKQFAAGEGVLFHPVVARAGTGPAALPATLP